MNTIFKNIFLILIVIGTFYFIGCSKHKSFDEKIETTKTYQSLNDGVNNSFDSQISFYWNKMNNNNSGRNIFHKIWHWFVAHAGTTMWGDCGLQLPCGWCPGFCLATLSSNNAFIPVADNFQIPEEDYKNGDRLIELALLNDSIMEINIINSDLVYNDTLFVYNDFNIGINASAVFEKDSIIVKKGNYPVTYKYGSNGNTILHVKTY